jgi:hypothetical protein
LYLVAKSLRIILIALTPSSCNTGVTRSYTDLSQISATKRLAISSSRRETLSTRVVQAIVHLRWSCCTQRGRSDRQHVQHARSPCISALLQSPQRGFAEYTQHRWLCQSSQVSCSTPLYNLSIPKSSRRIHSFLENLLKHKQIKQYQINAINMCLVTVCVHVFKSIKTTKLSYCTVTDSDQTLV